MLIRSIKKPIRGVLVGTALLTGLAGCVTPDRQYTATGAAIGSIAGAVLGHQVDGKNGRYAGGAAGALIGAAIGNNADQIRNRGYRENYRSGPLYEAPKPGSRYSYREQGGDDRRYDDYDERDDGFAPYPPRQPYYRY